MADRLPAGESRLEAILISSADIEARVAQLAAQISRDFAGSEEIHLVGVLKGAWVFLADLARAIRRAEGPKVCYHFLRASTYGNDIKGAGECSRDVRLDGVADLVRGADVILVEDILDQGFTLRRLRTVLLEQWGARSVRLCVLLSKALAMPTPEVAQVRRDVVPDYVGFSIADRWVAGYGLDVREEFRDLPYIATVNEARFQ